MLTKTIRQKWLLAECCQILTTCCYYGKFSKKLHSFMPPSRTITVRTLYMLSNHSHSIPIPFVPLSQLLLHSCHFAFRQLQELLLCGIVSQGDAFPLSIILIFSSKTVPILHILIICPFSFKQSHLVTLEWLSGLVLCENY